jgi:hypothetical protein
MIGFLLSVAPIMWQLGTDGQESDSVASSNHKLYCVRSSSQRTNGAFFAIRVSTNSSTYSGTDGQWKEPKEI